MKSKLLLLCLVFSIFGWTQTEQVTRFYADIVIDTSASIQVTEHIDIVSAGKVFKRGIVRYIPMEKKDSLGRKKELNLNILSVTKDGEKSNYHTQTEQGNLVIYVGDKSTFIPDGAHQYSISYTAENAVDFYPEFDEFYWNVNGFGWDFAMEEVSANVYLPNQALPIQTRCYTGAYGSTASNCEAKTLDDYTQFTSTNISRRENLTIALGFEKGLVNEPPPPPPPTFLESFGLFILASILFVFLGGYYFFTWQKHGVDPPKPTVYPLYEAPENLSPASLGILHKENYWNDLMTSSIVNLAVKGYLTIEEKTQKALFGLFKNKNFILRKIKESDNSLPKEEQVIMENLFKGARYKELDGEYDSAIKLLVSRFKDEIKNQHSELINEGNNYKFLILPILVVLAFVGVSIFFSIQYDTSELTKFLFGGLSFFPFLFFVIFALSRFVNIKWLAIIIGGFIVTMILVFLMKQPLTKDNLNIYSILGFLCFGMISLGFYQYLIKRPSEEKLRIQSLIDGFKMYLGTAENEQLKHFNPPEVTPEIFEKYLPYAIALDADEVWGEKFQSFLDKSAIDTSTYNAAWYTGSNFNAMNFGHSLNSNLSNSFSTSATPPSSSGSGSGGGGFSGGGGGGGGGGGW